MWLTRETPYIYERISFFCSPPSLALISFVFFSQGNSFLFLCFSITSVAHSSLRDELNYVLSRLRRSYLNLNHASRASAWNGCFNDATRWLHSMMINSNMRFFWRRYTQCGINSLEIFSQKFLNKQYVGETIGCVTFIIVSKQNSYLITIDPSFWDNELINHLCSCNCNWNNESESKEWDTCSRIRKQ